MGRERWDLLAGLARERVQRAATALLVIRVVEGLAAWLLFNEFFLGTAPVPWWAVPTAFVAYLTANLVVALRYRAGRVSTGLVLGDVVANLAPLAVPLAASGGLGSPLLLFFPLKTITYFLVFSPRIAWLSFAATGLMLAGVVVAGRTDLPVVRLYAVPPVIVYRAIRVALFALVVMVPLAITWLRRVTELGSMQEARQRSARDGVSDAVASALLTVSDTISRLTRLDEILEKVVEIAPRSLGVDYCAITLWAEENGLYTGAIAAGSGSTLDRRLTGLQMRPEEVPDFEWVRRLGHCAVVPATEGPHSVGLDVPTLLIAPLLSGDRFYGVMQFARRRPAGTAFTQRDMTIADGVARQTAVALERARLVDESRRLVRALESTTEAVLITDVQRRVIFANAAFLRMFGQAPEDIIGRDANQLGEIGAGWVADLGADVRQHNWRGETLGYRRDGTAVPILVNNSPILDDEGLVQGAVAIIADISAEKSFQAQLQRTDRLAAVGEMAAGMAHEINNALAAIFGQTEQRDRLDPGDLRAALMRVDGQGRRISEIVQSALHFARPRPPHAEPINLAAITRETLELIRHDTERQEVTLVTTEDSSLPFALADAKQVQQVLLNLFTNAVQAMAGRPAPSLRAAIVAVDNRVGVQVSDNGPGIAPDVLTRIFDPFFSTKSEGTGLGLSVSYAIARAHGGDLLVETELGRGTTFTLILPAAGPREQSVLQRALLIDDEPEVAEALAQMLVNEGLQVSLASTGREGLEMLSSGAWDAVFLDVRLPDVSGPEIFAELERTRPEIAQRVIFVTGGVWRSESRLRQQLPSQPILAKPCSQVEVRDVLRLVARQGQQAA